MVLKQLSQSRATSHKIWSYLVSIAILLSSISGYAQQAQTVLPYMPAPQTMLTTSSEFFPVSLRGLKLDPNNPFAFTFLVDSGTSSGRG